MSHVRWLAIDGALGAFSAAVLDGDRVFTGITDGKRALEQGLSVVEHVLAQAGLELSQIDHLAVGTGPGSFTGLRIAVSYAKGLALALQRPLAGVSSYDALEYPQAGVPVLAAAGGKAGVACARLRTADGSWKRCGPYDALASLVAENVAAGEMTLCGDVEGVAAQLGERGFTVRAMPFPETPALAVARLAAERFSQHPAPSPSVHDVRPDYGELPPAIVRKPGHREG